MKDKPAQITLLHPWQQAIVFLFSCAILVSRRPDAVFHAQFWAEDGHVWFADAFNFGWWQALLRAQDGYLQVFPRLAASLALLVPLTLAPLVLNLLAIAVQALPVNILLSSRSSVWGNLRFRAFLAGIYLVIPNSREMSAIITSSQWVLALCVFLLLVASTPRSALGRLFDWFVLLFCGLTGPFCAFLAPVALFQAWKTRDRRRIVAAGALVVCCLAQAWALLVLNPSGRSHYATALGASPGLFVRILAAQVYIGALLGGNSLAKNPGPLLLTVLFCAAIAGTAMIVYCFVRSTIAMRLFLVFSTLLFAVSLISPNTGSPTGASAWQILTVGSGIRYWFFPTIAFAWSILFIFRDSVSAPKAVSAVLLCVMCFGIIRDWRYPAFKDMHFADAVEHFQAAPPGTAAIFPENPEGWNMRLVKR